LPALTGEDACGSRRTFLFHRAALRAAPGASDVSSTGRRWASDPALTGTLAHSVCVDVLYLTV
ncbi:hypothetical protein, partial [uncultured Methylobacterium sp.]|uniref:hypothetical protein n=1 Tax=uncultured Methylobacterium sp. TaxID=157278 RepID=UPI002594F59C